MTRRLVFLFSAALLIAGFAAADKSDSAKTSKAPAHRRRAS